MSDSADAATCICGAFPGLVCGSQCKSRPGIRAIPTSGGMGRAVLESFVLGAMMSAEHCQTDESAGQCAAATVQQILSALSAVPGRIDLEEAAADPHADRGWQDIATAPKDGTPIIGWHERWDFGQVLCWEAPPAEINDGSHSGCANAWVYADWFQHDADNAGVEPTHWTPLPPPPEHAHPLPGTASAAANQNPSAVKPPVVGQLSSNPGQLEPSTSPREAGLREARDFLHRWAHLISNGPMCRDLEAMAIKGTAEDLEPLRQALSSGDRP